MAGKSNWVEKFGRQGKSFPVYLEVVDSPAYRSLRPLDRCLLEEFLILNRKVPRNGELNLPVAKAAVLLRVANNTIRSSYYRLMERGFIILERGAAFEERKARLWRISFLPARGREPTDDWRLWAPEYPVVTLGKNKTGRQELSQAGSKTKSRLVQNLNDDPKNEKYLEQRNVENQ